MPAQTFFAMAVASNNWGVNSNPVHSSADKGTWASDDHSLQGDGRTKFVALGKGLFAKLRINGWADTEGQTVRVKVNIKSVTAGDLVGELVFVKKANDNHILWHTDLDGLQQEVRDTLSFFANLH